MKIIFSLLINIMPCILLSQVSGTVVDSETQDPMDFVNVWIKNSMIGATTDAQGSFTISEGAIGDTLLVSNLGYNQVEIIAGEINEISLKEQIIELDDAVIMPMINSQIQDITTYKNKKKILEFYHNGHYSLARYFPYKSEYEKFRFIQSISLVTNSALKSEVKFTVQLMEATENGEPANIPLSDVQLLTCSKGKNEIFIDFTTEKIVFPENGFFVVINRLNLDEHKFSNKLARDILQPAIGIERIEQPRNTWLTYSGKWISPENLANFTGTFKNIAVNVQLTN